TPLVVDNTTDTGIKIEYEHPSELGADRIVGAAAAYHFYGGPVIVVDFGSATTFNLVTADGRYIGGAIAPGIKTATESLVKTAAKLPRIELTPPDDIVGKSTKSCMQSGIIYGYTGLVKYMLDKYKALPEMKGAKVVATGGLSELVASIEPDLITVTDRALALKGLKYIYDRNLSNIKK
ncbi:MAG: type III pantothenate kinase, partial [Clostridia bacterium]